MPESAPPTPPPDPATVDGTVLDPMELGPWTPEAIDALLGLGGDFGVTAHLTSEGQYAYVEWRTPIVLAGMPLWLFILANEDPSPTDPARWAWHVEVHSNEDIDEGRLLATHTARSRTEATELACGLLNVADHLAPDPDLAR